VIHQEKAGLKAISLAVAIVRKLAYEKAPHSLIADAADVVEVLPIYILKSRDCEEEFILALEHLATLGPALSFPLESYRAGIGEAGAHSSGQSREPD
jgi:hypothetical protein